MELSVAIVAYNALDKLRACLDSLATQRGVAVEVVVVDNASTEPVVETLRRDYPWVRLEASATNLGFAAGTNRAVAQGQAPWVLLLNPDTELIDPDTLARLLEIATQTGYDVLGCRMLWNADEPQPFSGRLPRALDEALDLLHLRRRPPLLYTEAGHGTMPVEFVSGACLLCRRSVWEAVGELSTSYFMYFEDADWCRRAAGLGYTAGVTTDLTILHHEGASYGERRWLRREHYWQSLMRYLLHYESPSRRALLRICLAFSVLLKLPWSVFRPGPDRRSQLQLLRTQFWLGVRGV